MEITTLEELEKYKTLDDGIIKEYVVPYDFKILVKGIKERKNNFYGSEPFVKPENKTVLIEYTKLR